MTSTLQNMRLKQLDHTLGSLQSLAALARPGKGWLRAIREAAAISSTQLAAAMGTSRQLPLQQEKAEAEGRITLKSLRHMADALECDLVYALVPRAGSMQAMVDNRARQQARSNVMRAEHTMALEDQAAGNLDEAIAAEAQRLAGKRRAR